MFWGLKNEFDHFDFDRNDSVTALQLQLKKHVFRKKIPLSAIFILHYLPLSANFKTINLPLSANFQFVFVPNVPVGNLFEAPVNPQIANC